MLHTTHDHPDPPETVLADPLDGNARHVTQVDASDFDAIRDAQHPSVVSVCCSDSRVSQEGTWDVAAHTILPYRPYDS